MTAKRVFAALALVAIAAGCGDGGGPAGGGGGTGGAAGAAGGRGGSGGGAAGAAGSTGTAGASGGAAGSAAGAGGTAGSGGASGAGGGAGSAAGAGGGAGGVGGTAGRGGAGGAAGAGGNAGTAGGAGTAGRGGASGAGGGAGSAGRGGASGGGGTGTASSLKLEYASATATPSQFDLKITNLGPATPSIAAIKVRYYFTDESGNGTTDTSFLAGNWMLAAQGTMIDVRSGGCSALTSTRIAPMQSWTDLGCAFSSPMAANDVLTFRIKFGAAAQNLTNDYSYRDTAGAFVSNDHLLLMLNGVVVYGTPPP